MRLFIAVPVVNSVAKNIENWLEKMDIPGKRVRVENLHFTLCFLGERPVKEINNIKEALRDGLKDKKAFNLSLNGINAFPSKKNPRVLFIEAKKGKEELIDLAQTVERTLSFYQRDKPFLPHLTVSRLKDYRDKGDKNDLESLFLDNKDVEFGEFKIDQVILFSSDLRPSGPIYTPQVICPLVD